MSTPVLAVAPPPPPTDEQRAGVPPARSGVAPVVWLVGAGVVVVVALVAATLRWSGAPVGAPPEDVPAAARPVPPPAVAPPPAPPVPVEGAVVVEVAINGDAGGKSLFEPSLVTFPADGVLRVTNQDTVPRSIASDRPGAFASPLIEPGGTWELHLALPPGRYSFHDGTRPFAVGAIQVVDPQPALGGAVGRAARQPAIEVTIGAPDGQPVEPARVSIFERGSIAFRNAGAEPVTIGSAEPGLFATGEIPPGGLVELRVDFGVGRFRYRVSGGTAHGAGGEINVARRR